MGPSLSSLNNGRWLPSAGVGYRFEFNLALMFASTTVSAMAAAAFTSRSAKRFNASSP